MGFWDTKNEDKNNTSQSTGFWGSESVQPTTKATQTPIQSVVSKPVDKSVDNLYNKLKSSLGSAIGNSLTGGLFSPAKDVFNVAKNYIHPTIDTTPGKSMEFPVLSGPTPEVINSKASVLDTKKKSLDVTNPQSIEDYNNSVNDFNNSLRDYNTAQKAQEIVSKKNTAIQYTPAQMLSHDLSQILNEPIKGAGEALGNTKVFENLAQKSDEGNFVPSFTEELAKHLQYGMGTISGVTGGIISPEYSDQPKDLASQLVNVFSQGIGMAGGIGALEKGAFSTVNAPTAVMENLKNYPRVAEYLNSLAKSIPAFATYGQLNPNLVTLDDRVKQLGKDILTSVPYTALGLIKKTGIMVPASAALGFAMAKLEGASNKDAAISATTLGLLSLMGANGKKQSTEVIIKEQAMGDIRRQAIETINKFSNTKISESSSEKQIKEAYKEAAMKTHPDVGGQEKDFSAVTYARDILIEKPKSTEAEMTGQKTPEEKAQDIKDTAMQFRKGSKTDIVNESNISKPLVEEARKYNNPEDFINAITKDKGGVGYVEYSPAKRLVEVDLNDTPLTSFGFKPNDKVTIYRGVDNASQKDIKSGDYIATSYDLAKSYTGGQVISKEVPASSVRFASSDGISAEDFKNGFNETHLEGVYNPDPLIKQSQLEDIWNRAHGIDTLANKKDNNIYAKSTGTNNQTNRTGKGNIQGEPYTTRASSESNAGSYQNNKNQYAMEEGNGSLLERIIGSNDAYESKVTSIVEGSGRELGNIIEKSKIISKGESIPYDTDTSHLLEAAGFPTEFNIQLDKYHKDGAFKNVQLSEYLISEGYYGALQGDTLMLNPHYADSEIVTSGKMLHHELSGHAWFNDLSVKDKNDFYQDLKTNKDIIKQAWELGKDTNVSEYWNDTVEQIYTEIGKVSGNKEVQDEIIKFVGLTTNTDMTVDSFVDESLNLDKTIEAINSELTRRGRSPIALKAENAYANMEHVAMIAENAPELPPDDSSMVRRYISDIQENTLSYGDQAVNNLTYPGERDITIKTLEKLKGRETVSKTFIEESTNSGDIKQVEREMVRDVLDQYPDGSKIPVKEFVDKVKVELLPLKVKDTVMSQKEARIALKKAGYNLEQDMSGEANIIDKNGEYIDYLDLPLDIQKIVDSAVGMAETYNQIGKAKYENIVLPEELRGNVKNYKENIYESPIKTSAGNTHFSGATKNYFGHTRIEDMADNKTRRVIEVQSDLYQKGNLEKEINNVIPKITDELYPEYQKLYNKQYSEGLYPEEQARLDEIVNIGSKPKREQLSKLQQYNDPTAHFRMIREEIKKAAQDGKENLLFPTGETAMKIEGLGEMPNWRRIYDLDGRQVSDKLEIADLKVGENVQQAGQNWIITDVLGDGKFKAIQKNAFHGIYGVVPKEDIIGTIESAPQARIQEMNPETFDISGKVDTNNPIYKFYEKDMGRYLKNQYQATPITDENGVTWWSVDITPEMATAPVVAFRKGTIDIEQLRRMLDRTQQSIDIAVSNPEAHAKAYGEGRMQELLDKRDELKARIAEVKNPKFDTGNKVEDLKNLLSYTENRVGLNKDQLIEDAAQRVIEGEDFGTQNERQPRVTQKQQVDAMVNTVKRRGMLSEPELRDILTPENINVEKLKSTPTSKIPLDKNLTDQQEEIEKLNIAIDNIEMMMEHLPGRELVKFMSKKEGSFLDFKSLDLIKDPKKKELMRLKIQKVMRASEKAFEGTQFADQYGNEDIIREAIDDYYSKKERIEELKQARIVAKRKFYKERNLFYAEERDRIAISDLVSKEERVKTLDKVEKILRQEGRDRKRKIDAVRDFFYLTQKEISDVIDGEDYRVISDKEFDTLMEKLKDKAYEIANHAQAVAEVEYTISQKNLKNTQNLQEALGMSANLKDMTTDQLEKFNTLLGMFERNDVFLGKREIETLAKNTDLPEVKTQRQIIEAIFPGISVEKLKAIQAKWSDYVQSASALSQNDPLKEYMVLYLRELVNSEEIEYRAVEKKVNELAKKARASRKRRLVDRIVPTDDLVRQYLEEESADVKTSIAKTMTPAELEFAHYLQDGWREKRDYLVKQQVLEHYIENYVTHRKRGFMEAWLKYDSKTPHKFQWLSRLALAVKETFYDAHKLDQIQLNIMNDKTGIILPLEKFFKYAMKRSGNLIPTSNMASAYLGYEKTFGRKKTLDMYMPKIEAVTRALAPMEETKGGLVMDETLLNFVKEFINTQKGRPMSFGPVLSPGSNPDIALRLGVALIRFKALAFNFASQITSPIGEQYATFIQQGIKKYALGVARARTTKGKEIVKKYEGIIGEKLWDKLIQESKDAGSKIAEAAFSGFSIASRQANIVHILGEMTPQEFKAGEIDPKRLATIVNDMGRWRAEDQLSGIFAKTSVGGVLRQFRSWAIPIATQTLKNVKKIGEQAKQEGFKKAATSKEMGELFRATIPALIMLWLMHTAYDHLKNKKNRSFLEQVQYKAMQEIGTGLSALTPSTFLSAAPLVDWVTKTGVALEQFISAMATGKRSKDGSIPGTSQLKSNFTPAILNQFTKKKGQVSSDLQDALQRETTEQQLQTEKNKKEFDKIDKMSTDEEKKNALLSLAQKDEKTASIVLDMLAEKTLGLTDEDKKIKSLGVENKNRAEYIYYKMSKLKTQDEQKAYLLDLATKEVITEKVLDQILELMQTTK